MFNLAIECSGLGGEIALSHDSNILAHRVLAPDVGSVRSLAPALREILADFPTIDVLSVTSGPGSFTGLRVGLATTKMLSFARSIPIAPVDTLEAIARRAFREIGGTLPEGSLLLPCINAFRGQLFAAAWSTGPSGIQRQTESQVVDLSQWQRDPVQSLPQLRAVDLPVQKYLITGPGLDATGATAWNNLSSNYSVAPEEIWKPSAVDVAHIGSEIFDRGATLAADELVPNYIRASAAEEKRRATK